MKKIRIILCFVLILGFCFDGCGTPAQNSSGDASGKESSQEEDSKTEVSSKMENTSKAEESSKPGESSKAENNSKAEVSSKPEESSVSEQSSKAEESSVKEESSQLEESSQAEESSIPEGSSPSADATWAAAYLDIVEDLQAEYGEGKTVTEGNSEGFAGLVVVSLIDFDLDGQPELYCGYLKEEDAFGLPVHQAVYGYSDGEIVLLFNQDASMTGGVNPGSNIWVTSDGTPYILMFDDDTSYYWGMEGGQFQVLHQYCSGALSNPPSWDGKEMSKEEAKALDDSFMDGATSLILVRYIDVNLGNGMNTLIDTHETIKHLRELAGETK